MANSAPLFTVFDQIHNVWSHGKRLWDFLSRFGMWKARSSSNKWNGKFGRQRIDWETQGIQVKHRYYTHTHTHMLLLPLDWKWASIYFIAVAEVALDSNRAWCPQAGCETICHICTTNGHTVGSGVPVKCPSCDKEFCSVCSATWHPGMTCQEHGKMLVKRGMEHGANTPSILGDILVFNDGSSEIKRCPMCNIPIERDAGCAQMMCKRCKHVFCWFCLTSLDVSGGWKIFSHVQDDDLLIFLLNKFSRRIFYSGTMTRENVKVGLDTPELLFSGTGLKLSESSLDLESCYFSPHRCCC